MAQCRFTMTPLLNVNTTLTVPPFITKVRPFRTIPLNVSDAASPGAVDAAQLIAASAKDAGINIEVIREPKDGYWSNVWNKKAGARVIGEAD